MIVDSLPFFGVLMDPTATLATVEPAGADDARKVASGLRQAGRSGRGRGERQALALKPGSIAKMKPGSLAADPRVTGAGAVRGS